MKKTPTISQVLVSAQRALLGMIYPSIRAVAIGYDKTKKLKCIYYLDREPNEDDYENINIVTSEICADIEFTKVDEVCKFTLEPISKLDNLDSWVYVRQEIDNIYSVK